MTYENAPEMSKKPIRNIGLDRNANVGDELTFKNIT